MKWRVCRDAERDDRELEKKEDIVAMLGRREDNDKLRKAENGRGRVAFGEMAEMTDRHREREERRGCMFASTATAQQQARIQYTHISA